MMQFRFQGNALIGFSLELSVFHGKTLIGVNRQDWGK
jgi:hypothetical protein